MTNGIIKTTVRINETNYKKLKILAIEQEVSATVLINEFIKDGLIKYGVELDE